MNKRDARRIAYRAYIKASIAVDNEMPDIFYHDGDIDWEKLSDKDKKRLEDATDELWYSLFRRRPDDKEIGEIMSKIRKQMNK